MRLPIEPAKGEDILRWARQVQAFLRSLTPRPSSAGILVRRSPNGTSWALASRDGGGGAAELRPWGVVRNAEDTHWVINPHSFVWDDLDSEAGVVGLDGEGGHPIVTLDHLTPEQLVYLKVFQHPDTSLDRVELWAGDTWSGWPDPVIVTGAGTIGDPHVVEAVCWTLHSGAPIGDPRPGVAVNATTKLCQEIDWHILLVDWNYGGRLIYKIDRWKARAGYV
jgi:hypothetical protein